MKNYIILGALTLLACTDDNEALKALDDQGYSNVTLTDRGSLQPAWNGCSDGDGAYYQATATNPVGKRVSVMVCCGGPLSFKGCLIRSK